MTYIVTYKRGVTRVCCKCHRRLLPYHMEQVVQPGGAKVWRCKDCNENHRPRKPKSVRKSIAVKKKQQPTESRIIK